ncbi:hypothetical protein KKC83_05280 [Patescibacteria group bacterium]|nr:hypothetical protein [Candidatus Falkowbacteria bacterium]MBU3906516.1 hypothetical protein [Patescibacteria group bacterium]MCG2698266.1 hypothetical protein [Candidatus Parcubacteria bacterium]MBU4014910.1 hypothetical protein [Patescibacteria group bacterium]MBU4026929.1 hypothetical protein [Patescibacteria group bacterium]
MKFLKYFPKNSEGLYIIYELYSFDNLFMLLLKNNFTHEEAINFVITACSLSGLIFQERIHNHDYLNLSANDALSPQDASIKSKLIFDILQCIKVNNYA